MSFAQPDKNKPKIGQFSAICNLHETEIAEKVEGALGFLLPEITPNNVEKIISKQKMEGHYRNTIIQLKFQIKSTNAEIAFQNLLNKLIKAEKNRIISEFDKRFDTESLTLFLRLDKQNLAQGNFSLNEDLDTVKVMIKVDTKGTKRIERSIDFLQEFLSS